MSIYNNRTGTVLGVILLGAVLAKCAMEIPKAISAEQAKQQRIAEAHLQAMKNPPKWSQPGEFTVFDLIKD